MDGLHDRSSAPQRHPNQTSTQIEDLVEQARREHKVGPVQLATRLADEHGVQVPVSTIYAILRRRGISRLADLDVTGEDLREPVRRYEWPAPGDMIHVDVKKIGRIPDGGGWAVHAAAPTSTGPASGPDVNAPATCDAAAPGRPPGRVRR